MKGTTIRPTACLTMITVLLVVAPVLGEWPYDVSPRGRGTPVEFGARVGHDYDGDAPSAGLQLRLPLPKIRGFVLAPSADVYNDGDQADWQVNLDLLMSAGPRGGFYAGLGFGWVEEGLENRERAVNQILGLRLPLGRGGTRAFIEGRWTELARDNVFRLVGGVNLPLFRL